MAYNNFPVGYQPAQFYYPQQSYIPPQTQAQQPQQVPNSAIIWVQGLGGAKSYLLAPNTTVPLWDSEEPIIYLKSTDASGMPSIKIIDYIIRDQERKTQQAIITTSEYVTKDEFAAFETQIKEQIASLTAKPRAKKEEKPDE